MGPKEKGKKKQTAVVVAAPIEVEADNEMTADQLRYIAEPWFTEIPQDVMQKARNIKWDQGVGGNHAVVNLAKKEMIRQNVEKAGLDDSGAVKFLGGVRAPQCLSDRLLQNGIWDVKGVSLIDVPIGYQRQYRYTSVYSFEWTLEQNHVNPTAAWGAAQKDKKVQLNAGHFCKVSHGMDSCRNEPWLIRGFRTVKSSDQDG